MSRLVYFGDLEAGLQGRLDWTWKPVEVTSVRIQGLVVCIGLLVEVACREQRLAP